MTIRHYLSLLVLAAFLPAAGLALALFQASVDREYEVTWQRAEARSAFTIAAIDTQLDTLSGTLDALSASPSLVRGDLAGFSPRAWIK